jgi:hypothetical protein
MRLNPLFITGIFLVTSAGAYSVKKGDSLSAISKNHYGTWNRWQQLWESNKELIQNPDLIFPGQRLQIPDAGEVLAAARESSPLLASNGPVRMARSGKKSRSQEWKMLPQQSWEIFNFHRSVEVGEDGFDRRSKIKRVVIDKINPQFSLASERIPIQGEIIQARSKFSNIFDTEQVLISAEEQLQVGKTYSITESPEKIISQRDERVGFAYELIAKVKIIGVRDGKFIGSITSSSQKPVLRKSLLIPEEDFIKLPEVVASSERIKASVITARFQNFTLFSENNLIILDVGSEDGVKPGMIFRHYLKKDPLNDQVITTKNYLVESEIQVLNVKDKFSTALILQSRSPISQGDEVVSLTDISDFLHSNGLQINGAEEPDETPANELDQYEDSEGLGEKEDQELRQLEKVDIQDSQEAAPAKELDEQKPEVPSTAPNEEIPDSVLDEPGATTKTEDKTESKTESVKKDESAIPEDLNIPSELLAPPSETASPSASPSPTPAPASP